MRGKEGGRGRGKGESNQFGSIRPTDEEGQELIGYAPNYDSPSKHGQTESLGDRSGVSSGYMMRMEVRAMCYVLWEACLGKRRDW